MKQYIGGHNETWGGVTIDIDRDRLDLGIPSARAESHCGGVPVDLTDYPRVNADRRGFLGGGERGHMVAARERDPLSALTARRAPRRSRARRFPGR